MLDITFMRDVYKDPDKFLEKDIQLCGWVRSNRASKNFGFLMVSDGTHFKPIQVVYHDDLDNFAEVSKYRTGVSLIVDGKLVATPDAKQPFELQASKIVLEGACGEEFPLQKKRHTLEYLRTIPHLRPRTNTFQAVFRIRSLIAFAIHEYFQQQGYVYVHTPIITKSDCEGAGEMFQITTLDLANVPMVDGKVDYSQDFYNAETHLTVSGQLNGETFAHAFRNIYTFGPTFRSEHSNTTRHASEFWMIEPEMCFMDLDDCMGVAEGMLKYIISYVLDNAPEEMEFLNNFIDNGLIERLQNVVDNEFGRITYTDAIKILEEHNDEFTYKVSWGADIQTEHERFLTEKVFGKPIFVTDYPAAIKSFYMKQNEDGKTVRAMDCLVPGIGEIMGGSQREEDYDKLLRRMKELDMNMEDYDFYMDLRKFGTARHSGYGLGFERCVMYITGIGNIRDSIPFPRTFGNFVM